MSRIIGSTPIIKFKSIVYSSLAQPGPKELKPLKTNDFKYKCQLEWSHRPSVLIKPVKYAQCINCLLHVGDRCTPDLNKELFMGSALRWWVAQQFRLQRSGNPDDDFDLRQECFWNQKLGPWYQTMTRQLLTGCCSRWRWRRRWRRRRRRAINI